MSQKVAKRTRKHTEDEVEQEFKNPGNSKPKEENHKNTKEEPNNVESETNGLKEESTVNGENGEAQVDSSKRVIQTRSRSNTPLKKNVENNKANEENIKGNEENDKSNEENDKSNEENNKSNEENNKSNEISECEIDIKDSESFSLKIDDSDTDKSQNLNDESNKTENVLNESNLQPSGEENGGEKGDIEQILSDSLEMEPLTEKDEEEAIPELQYDENDLDLESEGSPSRCRTRRSQTRNVSTPKTPKLVEGEPKVLYIPMERLSEGNASGSSTPKKMVTSSLESNVDSESQPDEMVDLDNSDSYSSASIDNISTKAVAGSDATRNVDLTYQDSGLFDDNSTSTSLTSPNRSLGETLRSLSSRRTIRPLNNDYRKIALQKTLEAKGDVYAKYESVQRLTPGLKRKNRSITPDEAKRFKRDGSGLFSYISSPIFSHFKSTLSKSSTPRLISYEKQQSEYDEPVKPKFEITNDDQQKKWCSIM